MRIGFFDYIFDDDEKCDNLFNDEYFMEEHLNIIYDGFIRKLMKDYDLFYHRKKELTANLGNYEAFIIHPEHSIYTGYVEPVKAIKKPALILSTTEERLDILRNAYGKPENMRFEKFTRENIINFIESMAISSRPS